MLFFFNNYKQIRNHSIFNQTLTTNTNNESKHHINLFYKSKINHGACSGCDTFIQFYKLTKPFKHHIFLTITNTSTKIHFSIILQQKYKQYIKPLHKLVLKTSKINYEAHHGCDINIQFYKATKSYLYHSCFNNNYININQFLIIL